MSMHSRIKNIILTHVAVIDVLGACLGSTPPVPKHGDLQPLWEGCQVGWEAMAPQSGRAVRVREMGQSSSSAWQLCGIHDATATDHCQRVSADAHDEHADGGADRESSSTASGVDLETRRRLLAAEELRLAFNSG